MLIKEEAVMERLVVYFKRVLNEKVDREAEIVFVVRENGVKVLP